MTDATTPVPSRCPALPAEDLVAWLDGELGAADARRVEAHVAGCAVCAREADLLRRSAALLAKLPARAAPDGFADRVVAAARDDAAPAGRLLGGDFGKWLGVAAAVLLVVAAAGWWGRGSRETAGLTGREEEEIARDLYVLAHLETLRAADDDELARLADDLDAVDLADPLVTQEDG